MRRPLILAVPEADARRREERERRLAALDAAILPRCCDLTRMCRCDAGDVLDATAVFDELEAKYERMAAERGTP